MDLPENDFALLQFSTDALPAAGRVEALRHLVGRTLLQLDIEPLLDQPLQVDLNLTALAGLKVATGTCSPIFCHHSADLIDNDDLLFAICLEGASSMRHRGREMTIGSGEALLSSCAEVGEHTFHAQSRFVSLRLPVKTMTPLIGDLSEVLMQPVSRQNAALRLLIDYLRVVGDSATLATPQIRHVVAHHLLDLAALALGAARDSVQGRSIRAARLRELKADILANIRQRSLSADNVARRHRLSERYLRKLFEADGTSFSNFVLTQRLALAHRLLTDPRRAGDKISSCAFDAGFSDLSYFNRTFKREYGATPSEMRERPYST